MNKIFEQLKWFLSLKDGSKVMVLLLSIIGLLLYNQHRISIDNKHLTVSLEKEKHYCDSSIVVIMAERNIIQKEAQAKVDTFVNRLLDRTEKALNEQKSINKAYQTYLFGNKSSKKK